MSFYRALTLLLKSLTFLLFLSLISVGKSKTGSSGSGPKRKLRRALERC